MLKLLSDSLGEYFPAFLYIYVDEKIDFDEFEGNEEEKKGTFIHEYCHFLQDVTTTYGINNAIIFFQELCRIIIPELNGNDIVIHNKDYWGLCNGDKDIKEKVFFINKIKIEKEYIYQELWPQYSNLPNNNVLVIYNGNRKFNFGNYCIAESMAYLIERRLYNVQERFDEFPYNVCEKICEKEYKEFAQEKINIIGLCELSLLSTDGGRFFVDALRSMKKNTFLPKDIIQLESFLVNAFKINYCGEIEKIVNLLDFLYPKYYIDFSLIKKWIISRYNLGISYRKRNLCFISLLLSEEDQEIRFNNLNNIMKEFGCPNVVDRFGTIRQGAYLEDKEIDIMYMLAPMAIYIMEGKKKGCPIAAICKQSEKSMYVNECDSYNATLKRDDEYICCIELFKKLYNIN